MMIYRNRQERGAVAIIVGLALAAIIGFAGLVIDLGRLYINKTELQSAADACALAAANELVCDTSIGTCPAAFLQNAEAAGVFLGSRNNKDFQASSVTIATDDVQFFTAIGPNSSYRSRSAGADPASKFAMCTTRSTGIVAWFMRVLNPNIQPSSVAATAVATLAPGQSACMEAPIGICAQPGFGATSTPPFGYNVGSWVASNFNANASNGNGNVSDNSNLTGNFRWVDFTPNAGGTNEVRDQLLGRGSVCGVRVGDNVNEQGEKQGAKSAWNTRFGFYPNGANAETPSTAPPDKTGYSYPSKSPGPNIPIGTSAYSDYRSKQALNSPFVNNQYAPSGAAGNISGNAISQGQYSSFGAERRLIAAPVIACGQANATPILGMACLLLLNPMSNGNTGTLYVEWRGLASASNSPCRSTGVAGGPTSTGALVPTLVQ